MSTHPEITYDANGDAVGFHGHEAVDVYRAFMLASHLKLYAKSGIIPTRGVGITKMLALAGHFTGKAYKRGEALKASEDCLAWAQTMKLAIGSREA